LPAVCKTPRLTLSAPQQLYLTVYSSSILSAHNHRNNLVLEMPGFDQPLSDPIAKTMADIFQQLASLWANPAAA